MSKKKTSPSKGTKKNSKPTKRVSKKNKVSEIKNIEVAQSAVVEASIETTPTTDNTIASVNDQVTDSVTLNDANSNAEQENVSVYTETEKKDDSVIAENASYGNINITPQKDNSVLYIAIAAAAILFVWAFYL
jgi:hypothetical protein